VGSISTAIHVVFQFGDPQGFAGVQFDGLFSFIRLFGNNSTMEVEICIDSHHQFIGIDIDAELFALDFHTCNIGLLDGDQISKIGMEKLFVDHRAWYIKHFNRSMDQTDMVALVID
jgi:hypothetical protein